MCLHKTHSSELKPSRAAFCCCARVKINIIGIGTLFFHNPMQNIYVMSASVQAIYMTEVLRSTVHTNLKIVIYS